MVVEAEVQRPSVPPQAKEVASTRTWGLKGDSDWFECHKGFEVMTFPPKAVPSRTEGQDSFVDFEMKTKEGKGSILSASQEYLPPPAVRVSSSYSTSHMLSYSMSIDRPFQH